MLFRGVDCTYSSTLTPYFSSFVREGSTWLRRAVVPDLMQLGSCPGDERIEKGVEEADAGTSQCGGLEEGAVS